MADSVTSQVAVQSQNKNAGIIRSAVEEGRKDDKIDVATIKKASERIIIAEPKIIGSSNSNAELALNEAIATLGKKAAIGDEMAIRAMSDIGQLSAANNLGGSTARVVRELKTVEGASGISSESLEHVRHALEAIDTALKIGTALK